MRHLEPSLDGSPLEVCLALLAADLNPSDFAAHLLEISDVYHDGLYSDGKAIRLLGDALALSHAARSLTELENIGTSLELTRLAKQRVRRLAMFWLEQRTCPCCIEMFRKLEAMSNAD